MQNENNFGGDISFLKSHVETIVLRGEAGEAIAIVPAYQGRTMTSTANGDTGTSFGWMNYQQIASTKPAPQINLYGGEERMWLGPEGGQFSIFFDPDAAMEFANWRTPSLIDTEPFELVGQDERSVTFTRSSSLLNYSRYRFELKMDRKVSLLSRSQIADRLQSDINGLRIVGHQSENRVTNIGTEHWSQKNGLLGIWMLCMSKPSPTATLVVPFKRGAESELGSIVNSDYFGKLSQDRLLIDEEKGLIYLLGDGEYRSKIGLTFERAQPRLGSWDAARNVLTIAEFNLPAESPCGYTNNVWEMQDNPFDGDVINGYNDGPNESGGMLGPFYELESLSPALALKSGEGYTHVHTTLRLEGERSSLDSVTQNVFGVGLDEIESKFKSQP